MILYFSGTGNSAYVARRIAAGTGDECIDLFERIRGKDFSPVRSERPFVVVAPTYAWRLPRIVQEWIEQTPLTGSRELYFVLTCGGSIGNAGKYLRKLCGKASMDYRGCADIVMPENYIALFSTPTREEALRIIEAAEPAIDRTIDLIEGDKPLPQGTVTGKDRLNSGIVNDVFYPLFVHAKKFHTTEACVSCGKCAAVCPLGNVRIENGKPVWGDSCTHCMACISRCPKEAIEYGGHSQGMARYLCPKED